MDDDLLDNFLSIAADQLEAGSTTKKELKEVDIFNKTDDCDSKKPFKNNLPSTIHGGDTDSSDDEDNKYHEERKYNESGRNIKHLLKSTPQPTTSRKSFNTWKTKPNVPVLTVTPETPTNIQDVYCDPIFGLRIINPIVSSATLQDRMVGREAVSLARVKRYVSGNISDKNWVIAGVIVGKSAVRTSQKGNQFLIWTLSDLKDDIKTVSVFLFRSAYSQLWKTATGTVIGILNPSVLDRKDGSKDEATLSIDNAQKVMILGQSKDLGKCRSTKKNGEQCTAIVNKSRCEYCIYHIKQEYQKCSLRSELQSNFSGKGLHALRNKVLGKNEVFYAGKLYTAIPAKKSKKLEERNDSLLKALNGSTEPMKSIKSRKSQNKTLKAAANVELTLRQRQKDLALLEKLSGNSTKETFIASHSQEPTLESSKKLVNDVLSKLKSKSQNSCEINKSIVKDNSTLQPEITSPKNKPEITLVKNKLEITSPKNTRMDEPLLSSSSKSIIDLSSKFTPKQINRAKMNALKYVQKNGPLKKADPNVIKSSAEGKKRVLEEIENQNAPKKAKIEENEFLSDRFKKMMQATSKHTDLLEVRDDEEQEKYFHKLEAKEKMEEKMINTFKVPCKAVRCLQCKYTNFSASQFCKDNKHPLKVFDAVKRFFQCGNCKNRTQTLEIFPSNMCKNCGSGKWERTGMMKEKTVGVAHKLSIRGGEQQFINSVVADANLDLLVPDE